MPALPRCLRPPDDRREGWDETDFEYGLPGDGLVGRLRRSLERYLDRTAAELDERGAELVRRRAELAELAAEVAERPEPPLELQERLDQHFTRFLSALDDHLKLSLAAIDERLAAGPQQPFVDDQGEAARAEFERLATRERALTEAEARVAAREGELVYEDEKRITRLSELVEIAAEVEQRERAIEDCERRLAATESERPRRLAPVDELVAERIRELDEREVELDVREATLEVDLDLRELDLERRERELTVLEERLTEKERELGSYVAQVQSELERREATLLTAVRAA